MVLHLKCHWLDIALRKLDFRWPTHLVNLIQMGIGHIPLLSAADN